MKRHLRAATILTRLLDSQFSFFGKRFGLDPIIGLIPFWGDLIALAISLYIVWVAYKLNVPIPQILRMIFNVLLDTALGAIPLLGDLSDFIYKANVSNLKIIERYADQELLF